MKLSQYLLPVVLVASAMTTMIGCGGGGETTVVVDPYYAGWYNVYGARCGSLGPGCNFYANGLKIIDIEDPYFDTSYVLENADWSYFDTYGDPQIFSGWAWLSPTNVLYDSFGNALNEKKSEGRDHVGDVIQTEQQIVAGAASDLSEKWGLSMETSMHVALEYKNHALIGEVRPRTKADIASTTLNLYGIDMTEVSGALLKAKQGDLSALDEVAEKGADNWGTTPETFKALHKEIYAKQVKEFSK